MTYQTRVSAPAARDTVDLFLYISDRNRSAGDRFLEAVDETIHQLSTMPNRGTQYQSEQQEHYRWVLVKGFPNHLIFFQVDDDNKLVSVTRILHGSQNIRSVLGQEESGM